MKKKLYYKVVKSYKNDFFSALLGTLPENFILRYDIGQKTVPKIGKILVFGKLYDAILFAQTNGCYYILEGYAENVGKPKYLCRLDFWDTKKFNSRSEQFETFWKRKDSVDHIFDAPEGTRSCSSFTPIKIDEIPKD